LWDAISSHRAYLESDGMLKKRRAERARQESVRIARGRFEAAIAAAVSSSGDDGLLGDLEDKRIDPEVAADRLVEKVSSALSSRAPTDEGRAP
jgi:putative protein kinase ArgK-like GTPase of G3E family